MRMRNENSFQQFSFDLSWFRTVSDHSSVETRTDGSSIRTDLQKKKKTERSTAHDHDVLEPAFRRTRTDLSLFTPSSGPSYHILDSVQFSHKLLSFSVPKCVVSNRLHHSHFCRSQELLGYSCFCSGLNRIHNDLSYIDFTYSHFTLCAHVFV